MKIPTDFHFFLVENASGLWSNRPTDQIYAWGYRRQMMVPEIMQERCPRVSFNQVFRKKVPTKSDDFLGGDCLQPRVG